MSDDDLRSWCPNKITVMLVLGSRLQPGDVFTWEDVFGWMRADLEGRKSAAYNLIELEDEEGAIEEACCTFEDGRLHTFNRVTESGWQLYERLRRVFPHWEVPA